ncbi:hypothetical protein KIH74_21150 [Kineosporia sp. J2-2]|uniref:Uncharacterized protein n=1 Tax=Kineosporia corallincola TaxID=2835133 RepID=A0ABS5TKU2_9ACTN|nr:hypothetical protein [Kineosporia corallincola]MBT0771458.1 hypothetical protein [Kineosporia corallincola]
MNLVPRSLTRAPRGRRRAAFPLVLLAQRWYRARYQRAPRGLGHPLAGQKSRI